MNHILEFVFPSKTFSRCTIKCRLVQLESHFDTIINTHGCELKINSLGNSMGKNETFKVSCTIRKALLKFIGSVSIIILSAKYQIKIRKVQSLPEVSPQ